MKKVGIVALNTIPIWIMVFFIPFVLNDYLLSIEYLGVIIASLSIKYYKNDILFFIFGLGVMTIFEYTFISTGVETFSRQTFLGVMPIWLPILWGYGFVVIKRSIEVLNRD